MKVMLLLGLVAAAWAVAPDTTTEITGCVMSVKQQVDVDPTEAGQPVQKWWEFAPTDKTAASFDFGTTTGENVFCGLGPLKQKQDTSKYDNTPWKNPDYGFYTDAPIPPGPPESGHACVMLEGNIKQTDTFAPKREGNDVKPRPKGAEDFFYPGLDMIKNYNEKFNMRGCYNDIYDWMTSNPALFTAFGNFENTVGAKDNDNPIGHLCVETNKNKPWCKIWNSIFQKNARGNDPSWDNGDFTCRYLRLNMQDFEPTHNLLWGIDDFKKDSYLGKSCPDPDRTMRNEDIKNNVSPLQDVTAKYMIDLRLCSCKFHACQAAQSMRAVEAYFSPLKCNSFCTNTPMQATAENQMYTGGYDNDGKWRTCNREGTDTPDPDKSKWDNDGQYGPWEKCYRTAMDQMPVKCITANYTVQVPMGEAKYGKYVAIGGCYDERMKRALVELGVPEKDVEAMPASFAAGDGLTGTSMTCDADFCNNFPYTAAKVSTIDITGFGGKNNTGVECNCKDKTNGATSAVVSISALFAALYAFMH